MTRSTATPRKRKQLPPTFKHLPVERAKKLKKDWVEKKKIISKFKHETQKGGWGQKSQLPVQEHPNEATNAPDAHDSDAAESDAPNSEAASDDRESTTHFSTSVITEKPQAQSTSMRQVARKSSSQSDWPRPFAGSKLESSKDYGRMPKDRWKGRVPGSRTRTGTSRVRGKQPDMRAKMGDLLEKIQKAHASR